MPPEVIKVLLIEDDEDDYLLTREMLSAVGSCRFELTWVTTYEDAIIHLKDGNHDVCVIDYHLGERTGVELLSEANAQDWKFPAIFLTGNDASIVDLEAIKAGAMDYLIKGQINRPLLERSIRYAIERGKAIKALRESEYKYRQIVETAREGIWVIDEEGRTTYVNHRTTEMLGYSPEEMLGRASFDFLEEGSGTRAKKNFEHRKLGRYGQHEYCFRHKDGTLLWVIVSTNPVFKADGQFGGAFAMITDITERKREEEENKRLLYDLKERVKELGAIHETARILQSHEKEIPELLKEVVEILPPAWQYPEITAARIVYNGVEFKTPGFTSTAWKQTAEFRTANGIAGTIEVVYLEERAQVCEGPFLVEERSLINSVAEMLRLELDRRLATEALFESETQLERAQAFALVMTTHVGLDGRWLKVPPTLCESLGYTEEELLKLTYRDLTHPEDVANDVEQHERLLRGELKSYDLEKRYIRRDGNFVWVYLNCSLVTDSKGNPVHFLTYIIDITERKRVAEERDLYFTNAFDMLCIAGFDGYFKQVNPAWGRTLGYTDEEFLSVPFLKFVHPDDREATVEQATQNGDGFNTVSFENRYRAKDGSYRWLSWSSTTSKDRQIIYGSARDITEEKLTKEKLQESERRFRQLAENINEVFWISAPDKHEVLYVSPAYEEIWGRSRESLYERADSYLDFIHPEDSGRMRAVVERMRQGENRDDQYRVVRPDGSIRWVRDRAFAVKDEDGVVTRLVGIAEDITERRQAEEQLRRQLDFTEATTASLGEGVYALDTSGRVTFMNPAAEAALGWTEEELLGKQMHEIIHFQHSDGTQRPADECPLLGVLSSGRTMKVDSDSYIRKGGMMFPVSYTAAPIITDGQVVGVVVAFHDITERKRAEEKLRESEERYRDIVENARDIIYTQDLEGNYTSLNKAGEQITGYTREETCRMNVAQVAAPEYLEKARRLVANKLTHGGETVYELEIVARDGHRVAVEVNSRLIRQGGVPVGVQGIARDITARKRLEEQLRQSQKMESIGLLAGGIAHDFNNLLTAILGNTQLAARRLAQEDPVRQQLEEVREAAQRAAKLTGQLLAFSRRQRLERRPIDVNETVGKIMKMVRRIIGEDMEVEVMEGAGLPPAYADAAQVEQVVMNLAVNARDAMPGGGRLTIETHAAVLDEAYSRTRPYVRPGHYVEIRVSDTGTGMDAATRERIFEPFFTTKPVGQGTGLGLATVYGIVKQHDGHINVYSEPGHGATFKVYLPVATAEAEEPLAPEQPPLEGGAETILVAEDEETLRRLVRGVLEGLGYTVLLAKDGEEAVEMYAAGRGKVDLLLLDVVMPRMGGQEAYERMRALGNGVPVIFMTGYSIDTVQDRFVRSAGLIEKYAAALIQKPYTVESLGRTVRRVLDEQRGRTD